MHKLYNLDQEIQKATQEKVWLKNGGYLVIQHTEALHVIDVNSGKYIKGKDAQKTYRKINEEAAKRSGKANTASESFRDYPDRFYQFF